MPYFARLRTGVLLTPVVIVFLLHQWSTAGGELITHEYLQSEPWRSQIDAFRTRLVYDGVLQRCPLFADDFTMYRWVHDNGWMGIVMMSLVFGRAVSTLEKMEIADPHVESLDDFRRQMHEKFPHMGPHPAGVVDYDMNGDLVTLIGKEDFNDEAGVHTVKSALLYRLIRNQEEILPPRMHQITVIMDFGRISLIDLPNSIGYLLTVVSLTATFPPSFLKVIYVVNLDSIPQLLFNALKHVVGQETLRKTITVPAHSTEVVDAIGEECLRRLYSAVKRSDEHGEL